MAKKVLVVDDEAEFVNAVDMLLEANGYIVISACNGDEGYNKAVKEGPDLILLDLVMPDSNGIETLSRLKSDPRTSATPILILTAKSDREYILDAGRLGASYYIVKPVSMQELSDTVKRYLG